MVTLHYIVLTERTMCPLRLLTCFGGVYLTNFLKWATTFLVKHEVFTHKDKKLCRSHNDSVWRSYGG